MYILPHAINFGLKDGQKWPSEAHEYVAKTFGLCNPSVCTLTDLMEVVQAVIAIPLDRIESVTLEECRGEFQVPFIGCNT